MKDKWIIAFVVGFVMLILITYFVGKSYGKSLPPKKIDEPEDLQENGTVSNLGSRPLSEIQQLTDDFYNDIKGISWFFDHNMAPYQKFLTLSNTDKVRVINDWNTRYYHKWSQNIAEAIKGERYSSSGNAKLAGAVVESIEKLSK